MKLILHLIKFPRLIFKRLKTKFVYKVKASAENPKLHGNSAKHVFKAMKIYASIIGVNSIFIKRADAILNETRSLASALRFLDIYISLKRKKPISRFEFHQYLKTDEDIDITENIIREQLNEDNVGSRQYSLQFQLFRLQNKSANDPEVIAYVKQSMQETINERLNKFQGRKKYFTKEAALSTLIKMKEVFDKNDKRFFLDRGTLLGAVRDKDFVASDYDIDVGVFSDEISLNEIIDMFKGTDFALNQQMEYKVAFTSPSGIQVDFFLSVRENGYIKSKGIHDIHNWYFSDFELIEYDFLGHSFFIPDNYEKHLEENYGNWKTPALFYDPSYDEANLIHGDNFETLMYLTNRFRKAVRKNQRFHAHEPAKIMRDNFDIDFTEYFPKKTGKVIAPKKNKSIGED